MDGSRFPELRLSGSPEEIGLAHGCALRKEIQATIDFYAGVFRQTEADIFTHARHFRRVISHFQPDYITEIEALAEGADVDPLWIVALNSRSELMSLNGLPQINECTAFYFAETGLLAQNWDWARRLETLVVLMELERPNHPTIRMMTEPGIIGKIGLNSAGIGVCLNFLRSPGRVSDGVPVHIVLRAILDSQTAGAAEAVVHHPAIKTTANVLLADGLGTAIDVEFDGADRHFPDTTGSMFLHTNHYVGEPINSRDDLLFESSFARLDTARELTEGLHDYSLDTMKRLLLDRSHSRLPICRGYVPDPDVEEIGTVCSIIMDLQQTELHIRRGNGDQTEFVQAFADSPELRNPPGSE